MTYNVGNGIEGACANCGCYPCWCDWIDAQNDNDEVQPHYHVVEFINGCLNDYDSGPYETLEDAREEVRQITEVHAPGEYIQYGKDKYERSDLYILKIEECTEKECEKELHRVETDFSDLPFVEIDLEPAWFGGTTNEEGEVYGG